MVQFTECLNIFSHPHPLLGSILIVIYRAQCPVQDNKQYFVDQHSHSLGGLSDLGDLRGAPGLISDKPWNTILSGEHGCGLDHGTSILTAAKIFFNKQSTVSQLFILNVDIYVCACFLPLKMV